jgi:hypothetical protein
MHNRVIKDFRFEKDYWLSRPVWYWRDLSNYAKIEEISQPWRRNVTKYVFAEDSSSFFEREECREFTANLDSPYIRRYIRYFPELGVQYNPRANLL